MSTASGFTSVNEDDTVSWTKALPTHSIFMEATQSGPSTSSFLICESRGDLFIWAPNLWCLLTTNLKRLHAKIDEDEVYQKLHLMMLPTTQPLELLPSSNGKHLMLRGTDYVIVTELRRLRGPHGEFSGGVRETDCLCMSIGSSIIRAHCLGVVQCQWDHSQNGVVAMLTSDGALRLFNIAQPSVPILFLKIIQNDSLYQHTIRIDDDDDEDDNEHPLAMFSLWNNSVFLLQNKMDVQVIPLSEGAQPSCPLPIYPLVEDNYNCVGRDLLLLPTQPPLLVIAVDDGRVFHCLYVKCEAEDETTEDEVEDEGIISTIETIELSPFGDKGVKLLADPDNFYYYSIITSTAIYRVHISWLTSLHSFSLETPVFNINQPCVIHQLMDMDYDSNHIVDGIMMSDDILGQAILTICHDGQCCALKINTTVDNDIQIPLTIDTSEDDVDLSLPNEFYDHINLILMSSHRDSQFTSLPKPLKSNSQKDCFEYLHNSIKILKKRHILPQSKASSIINERVKLLKDRYTRQIERITELEDIVNDLSIARENLRNTMIKLQHQCQQLSLKVEYIYTHVTNTSPILSNDEKKMFTEIQLINDKIDGLKRSLKTASSKVSIGLCNVPASQGTLSNESKNTIISALKEDGDTIKTMIQEVKFLQSVTDTT